MSIIIYIIFLFIKDKYSSLRSLFQGVSENSLCTGLGVPLCGRQGVILGRSVLRSQNCNAVYRKVGRSEGYNEFSDTP